MPTQNAREQLHAIACISEEVWNLLYYGYDDVEEPEEPYAVYDPD